MREFKSCKPVAAYGSRLFREILHLVTVILNSVNILANHSLKLCLCWQTDTATHSVKLVARSLAWFWHVVLARCELEIRRCFLTMIEVRTGISSSNKDKKYLFF